MENPKKLEWKKVEVSGGIENKPASVPRQTILLDNFLLCFSIETEICVFDLINLEWSKITPLTPRDFTPIISPKDNPPICVIDQSTLFVLTSNPKNYSGSLYSLTIDNTQVPWQMEWKTLNHNSNLPYRLYHTAQPYKKSVYIFGGKDRNNTVQDDLLMVDSKTCAYLQINTTGKPKKRYDHSSLIHNEKLFIYGGSGDNGVVLNDIWAWDLKNKKWDCISAEGNPSEFNRVTPAPRCLSLMQSFGSTLFFLQGKPKDKCQTLLSFDTESRSWENLTFNGMPGPFENPHCFAIYKNKFVINNDDFDFYEAGLFNEGSPKLLKEDGTNDVASDLKQLFKEKLFCDVAFKVEDEEVPAHKGILAGRSDYFKKMFTSNMSESQSKIIEVPGVKKDVFKALIEFLYCGSTNITEGIALDLFRLSDKYLLEKLRNKCETFLMYHIRPESVIDIINTADKLETFNLRNAALEYIMTNFKAVKKVDKMSRLTESVLCDLIDRDSD